MNWKKLLADNRVVAEPTSKAELDNLRSIVTRSLKDIAVTGLSTDTRFVLAYDAARTLSLTLREGFDPQDSLKLFIAHFAVLPAEALQKQENIFKIVPALRTAVNNKIERVRNAPEESEEERQQQLQEMLSQLGPGEKLAPPVTKERQLQALEAFKAKLSHPDAGERLFADATAAVERCDAKTTRHYQERFVNALARPDSPYTQVFDTIFNDEHPLAIVTANRLREIVPNAPREALYLAARNGNMIAIDHRMIDDIDRGYVDDFSNMLFDLALRKTGLALARQGASALANREIVSVGAKREYFGKIISSSLNQTQLLGSIHAFLHDGKHTEQQLREDMPICMAFYDDVMAQLSQKAREIEGRRLPEPSWSAPSEPITSNSPVFSAQSTVAPSNPDDLLRKATEFAETQLHAQPPYPMFRCHLNPSVAKVNPITITMSRWVRSQPDLPLETQSVAMTLPTNEPDLDRALQVKQDIQSHILNMPGISPYRRIVDGRIVIDDDDIIPASTPLNGNGRGELVKQNGIFRLHLEYKEDNTPLDVYVTLGQRQDEANRAEAQRRADVITDRLEHLHSKMPPLRVTRGEMYDFLHRQIPSERWQQAEHLDLQEMPRTIDVNYPDPDKFGQRTSLLIEKPYRAGSPTESWKVPVRISVNDNPIKIQHFNLHTLNQDLARQRVRDVVENVKAGFEGQNRNSRWHLDNQGKLMTLQTEAARTVSPDMDTTRLEDICNDAERYGLDRRLVTCHQVDVVDSQPMPDNRIKVTFSIQRNNGQEPQGEWFMEKHGSPVPARVERAVSFPAQATSSGMEALITQFRNEVNGVFERQMYEMYATRDNATYQKEGVQRRKYPLEFNQNTFPNLLGNSIATVIGRGHFSDARPEFTLPSRPVGMRRSFYFDSGDMAQHHKPFPAGAETGFASRHGSSPRRRQDQTGQII